MGKAVGAVKKIGGKAFGAFGGNILGGLAGGAEDIAQGNPAFKGATRKIDKKAFEIGGADMESARARGVGLRGDKVANQAVKQQQQARAGQSSLVQQLQRQAAGKGPSLAQAQLKAAGDRSLAQQLAAAAAQRGGNQAALQRTLARSQQAQGAELAQQSAQARIQEQLNAQQQLGSALQAQRGQDLSALTAGQQQSLAGIGQSQQIRQAQQQARANLQGMETDQFLAAQGLDASSTAQARAQQGNMIGGLMDMGGKALAISDKDNKKNIKSHGKVKKYSQGGVVPGKAKVPGDSPKNDTVDVKVSPDEVIIPRTAVKKGTEGMIDFILKLQKKHPKLKQGGKYFNGSELEMLKSEKLKAEGVRHTDPTGTDSIKKKANPEKSDKVEKSSSESNEKLKNLGNAQEGESKDAMATGESLHRERTSRMRSYSDKNKKKSKKTDPKSFLDALTAYSYEYKDDAKKSPLGGKGKFLGVMAQDLEKTPVGKQMVQDTPQGKVVDYGKGFGAILAAQAHLNERLSQMEKKKKRA